MAQLVSSALIEEMWRTIGASSSATIRKLQKQRGKEQELRRRDLEAVPSFTDAALAQDDDLLAAPQRIDDYGPFFECRSHAGSLGNIFHFGNARTRGEEVISNQCSVIGNVPGCQPTEY